MSARDSSSREVRQSEGEGLGRLGVEALSWIAYLVGVGGVSLFGSGGASVSWIAGYGLVLAVAACLFWAAVGRMMLGIGAFIVLGLFFHIGNDPQEAMEAIVDSGLGPTYFGMHWH